MNKNKHNIVHRSYLYRNIKKKIFFNMIEIFNKIWFPTEFTISFFSVFSALRFFDGGIGATDTVGVASVIGARGADTIGGATPTGSTLSGTFIKGNSLFGLNIFVSLISTFSLSAFSFSARIDGGVNSAGGGINGFSRSTGLILGNGKSSGLMGGLEKRGGNGKLGMAG